MSETRQNEQDIERLLHAAGQRRTPPDDMRARVYASTLQAWQDLPARPAETQSQRRWSNRRPLALAASTVLAVAAGLLFWGQNTPPASSVGEVVFVAGDYLVDGSVIDATAIALDPEVSLRTKRESLVSLRMGSGALVTVDENTRVSLTDTHTLFLHTGRVYLDVDHAAEQLAVLTKHARIVDVGTQFEVAVGANGDQMTVAVREGRIDVQSNGEEFSATTADGMGEVVQMQGNAVTERYSVLNTSARWDWRRAGREPYVLADSTVYDYLRWMARDTGHELHFASKAVEQMAKIGVLQGKGDSNSDDIPITDTLAATRFRLSKPGPGRWMISFRS